MRQYKQDEFNVKYNINSSSAWIFFILYVCRRIHAQDKGICELVGGYNSIEKNSFSFLASLQKASCL